ncbi:L-serine ammonia-lyase [Agrobacterium sp. LAD9]|uniref:L-serine ammonia-lyase n=1 Tax=Agrobacterium sp. LAD9 TaxID=2055153 RepID=UPI000D1FC6F8|nr:L-serine ammonia-lyase [Agrobacterium sp. LAD9]
MFLSVFELFKVGIGPSSSHTVGPMVAAGRFLGELQSSEWPRTRTAKPTSLKTFLHGSLAFTGIGHGTDKAIILGLNGYLPDRVDLDVIDTVISQTQLQKIVAPPGHPAYGFDPAKDIVFNRTAPLPGHSNGLAFEAYDGEVLVLRRVYYSVGGGFVVDEHELALRRISGPVEHGPVVPYPFASAKQMLEMARQSGFTIAEMKHANEETVRTAVQIQKGLEHIWAVMSNCIDRGLRGEGILPGGLRVQRRAASLFEKLARERHTNRFNPLLANDWLSLYAIAVNEENAAGGRVVTAPTNGAAGVIPAVLRYFVEFHADANQDAVNTFLLTASAIGGIIKSNASISGAEVGCQGEVGSASAMAAAGLAAALGGSPEQIEHAAEIALEHHLGMTCDPVAGLVQVPCIERNAFGAVKAVTAASLALKSEGGHIVPLDICIETMRQTGADMNSRYKETSLGGLAVNVTEC